MNLINMYCRWKIELIGQPLGKKKNVTTITMYVLRKNVQKFKSIIFPLMTTFYNFALKIETSWVKKVVKPISETWNIANDVIAYFGLFILW